MQDFSSKSTESNANGFGAAKEKYSPLSTTESPVTGGFLADIEDLIKATTSMSGEDLAQAKEKLLARLSAAKQSVSRMGTVVTDRTRAQPWQTLGIAAAIGLVAGFLLSRRS